MIGLRTYSEMACSFGKLLRSLHHNQLTVFVLPTPSGPTFHSHLYVSTVKEKMTEMYNITPQQRETDRTSYVERRSQRNMQ